MHTLLSVCQDQLAYESHKKAAEAYRSGYMDDLVVPFAGVFRDLQNRAPFSTLTRRPELTMVGRTYATGREPNLEFMLLKKPRQTALNPEWPWAVWYPLRRKPNFAILEPAEQGKILYEHATIGMAFGAADAAHDVRVSCYGLDQADNAMGDATGRLGEGNADGAVDSQGKALEALRKGAQSLADAMRQGDGDGQMDNGPGNRAGRQQSGGNQTDPLGRPLRGRDYDDSTVKVPLEADVQRARRILDELRRRYGETSRPQLELDYIERLLKDY